MKRLALAAALAALLAGPTACADTARTVTTYEGAYTSPVPDVLVELPSFTVGPTGVTDDLTTELCPSGPGAAEASGSVTNSGQFERDVVLAVTWVDLATRRPVARVVGELTDLDPAESRDWGFGTTLDRSGLACTVAAYAGQLG